MSNSLDIADLLIGEAEIDVDKEEVRDRDDRTDRY